MRDFADMLDEHDWQAGPRYKTVTKDEEINDDWFYLVDYLPPAFEIQYSWGGSTDLPLGLDLSEVG